MFYLLLVIAVNFSFVFFNCVNGHAYLSEPPSRSSAWLIDPDFVDCCKNYNYNQMFCGGFKKQWEENGGKCGICGDSWDEAKSYEKGGDKYLGKIVRNYTVNQKIPVTVQLTANHLGFFEFRICDVDGWESDATQECLNKTLLTIDGTTQSKYNVLYGMKTVDLYLTVPTEFTCNHCVLQWKYVAGNSWGFDPERNKSCVGCGVIQENFLGCADISIIDPNSPKITTTSTSTKNAASTNETTTVHESSIATVTSSSDKNINSTLSSTQSANISTTSHVHLLETTITPEWDNELTNTTTLSPSSESSTQENLNQTSSYRGCRSKLVFGSMSNIDRVVKIYCYRMCKLKCDSLLNDYEAYKKTQNDLDKSESSIDSSLIFTDDDLVACLETCPVLCTCN